MVVINLYDLIKKKCKCINILFKSKLGISNQIDIMYKINIIHEKYRGKRNYLNECY